MSRGTIVWDRLAAVVVAVLLLAAGLFGLAWWEGSWSALPATLDLAPVTDVLESTWWPWVAGVAAVLLALLGLRWLFAHLPRRNVSRLVLPGSDRSGRLRTHAGHVADAAAGSLAETPGVRSASGSVQHDRGQLVAQIRATIEPDADLALVAGAADRVSAELARVLARDDLHCGVWLSVAAGRRTQPRVQ